MMPDVTCLSHSSTVILLTIYLIILSLKVSLRRETSIESKDEAGGSPASINLCLCREEDEKEEEKQSLGCPDDKTQGLIRQHFPCIEE